MYIEKSEFPGDIYCDRITCAEHCTPAEYLIRFDGCVIPMCQECLDELYEEILPQVSAEVRGNSK